MGGRKVDRTVYDRTGWPTGLPTGRPKVAPIRTPEEERPKKRGSRQNLLRCGGLHYERGLQTIGVSRPVFFFPRTDADAVASDVTSHGCRLGASVVYFLLSLGCLCFHSAVVEKCSYSYRYVFLSFLSSFLSLFHASIPPSRCISS